MVRAIDVADFFIDRMKNNDEPMTDFLVNGFLYLSQGHCLARHGTALFDDDIIAEKQGRLSRRSVTGSVPVKQVPSGPPPRDIH